LTVDLAVGLCHHSPDSSMAQSAVRRMLERDFETGYGPRTVPTSNILYYSSNYADGQLGGYWTRAALSHAVLAFSAGCPSVGSSQLEKVARLVHMDAERLGGVPGEFPYWIDTERKQIVGSGSDPVAAARFLEGVILGEAGLTLGPSGARFAAPESSQLRWMMIHGLELGQRCSLFLGRGTGGAFAFSDIEQDPGTGSSPMTRLAECERISGSAGIEGLLFWDATTSLLCLGNTTMSQASAPISVPVRSRSFATSLFAILEELQPETGKWLELERVKLLLRSIELKADLRPGSWKVLKLSKV